MDCLLPLGAYSEIFAVPADVVDRCLNEASPDDIKVLLTILRLQPKNADEARMSDFLGLTVKNIRKSIEYWVKKGLLVRDMSLAASQRTTPVQAASLESREQPEAEQAAESAAQDGQPAAQNSVQEHKQGQPVQPEQAQRSQTQRSDSQRTMQEPPAYTSDEIGALVGQNPELQFLLSQAPQELGRLLTQHDCAVLVYLFSDLGMPADVVLMLIEYCVSIGKRNTGYIQATGAAWADAGILTHELAESRIRELEARRSYEGQVRSIMGISGRNLTPTEVSYINRWQKEFGTPAELIALGYEICVNNIGKISFAYINKILEAWHQKGVRTAEQAKNENRRTGKKSGADGSHSYDMDEYVRLSMKRLHP